MSKLAAELVRSISDTAARFVTSEAAAEVADEVMELLRVEWFSAPLRDVAVVILMVDPEVASPAIMSANLTWSSMLKVSPLRASMISVFWLRTLAVRKPLEFFMSSGIMKCLIDD